MTARPPDTYGSGPGVPKRLLDAFGPLGDEDSPRYVAERAADTVITICWPLIWAFGALAVVRAYLRED